MSSVNKVIILGNLGNDPDIRYMTSGDAVANVSIATSEKWKEKSTGEKKQKTEWHRVIFFRKLAEIVGEYISKGDTIYVEGRLETKKWTDKDNVDRYTTEIIASNMQMIATKRSNNASTQQGKEQQTTNQENVVEEEDDIPF